MKDETDQVFLEMSRRPISTPLCPSCLEKEYLK